MRRDLRDAFLLRLDDLLQLSEQLAVSGVGLLLSILQLDVGARELDPRVVEVRTQVAKVRLELHLTVLVRLAPKLLQQALEIRGTLARHVLEARLYSVDRRYRITQHGEYAYTLS